MKAKLLSFVRGLKTGTPPRFQSYLKSLALLLVLMVGVGNVWGATEKTWSHTIVAGNNVSSNQLTINGVTWNVSTTVGKGNPSIANAADVTYNSTKKKAIKFGSSSSNYYKNISFSTSYFSGKKVKSVTVGFALNGGVSTTLTATQGETQIGSQTYSTGQTWTTKTMSGKQGTTGNLTINVTTTQSVSFYSFEVVYDEEECTSTLTSPTPSTPSNITMSGATLSWSDVENASSYTLTIGATEIENAESPYVANDLQDNTEYTWSVKAIGDGTTYCDSEEASGTSFTTLEDLTKKTINFPFTSNISGWPTSSNAGNRTYTIDKVDYTFSLTTNVYCNSTYLMVKSSAALGLPAIKNYKLTKVVISNSSGCSTKTSVSIREGNQSTSSAVTGGADQTFATTSSSYTYNLSGTAANTMYYVYVASANCQVTNLALTYSYVEPTKYAVYFSNPSNGTLTINDGTKDITSGTTIAATDELTVTATPANGAYRLDSIRVIKSGSEPVEDVTASVYNKSNGIITMPAYAITVSAPMEANNYDVIFHSNTTPAQDDYTQTFTYTVAQNLTANTFTAPTGYEFYKWATTAEGEGTIADKAEYTLPSAADADLYAKWVPKNISVTLDRNGSSESEEDNGLALIDYDATEVGDIEHAAAWAEHTLNGYFTAASAGEMVLDGDGKFVKEDVTGWIVNGKWVMDKDTTLYAQWKSVSKYNITNDLTGCTANAGNPTEIALDAQSVTLNFTLVSDLYTWTDAVVYVTMGGAEMSDFTFTDGALVITPASGFTGDIAVGIICDYAPATLTLSALGNEYPFGDDLQVNDKVTLPSEVSVKAAGKTFVGWSSVTIETAGDKPTSNYWAKGAEYTISSTADKLYAVYATEQEGETTWSVATGLDDLSANDKIAFACLNGTVSVANGGKTGTNNYLDSVNITVDNNEVTAGAERIVPITLGGNATDGWTMFMPDYGYIAGSYASGSKNTLRFSVDPVTLQDFFINTSTYEASLTVANDSVLKYNSNSPRFSVYASGQTAIKILKASQEESEFSEYTTSGTLHVDAPTFDDLTQPGTFTDAEHLVMINVPTGTTVHYTTDGTTPDNTSSVYDENEGIILNATATVKAIAYKGDKHSTVLEGVFKIHNYNTVAALIAGAEHNNAAVLNLNEVFVLGVYSTAKQIFVQEGTKGVILTMKESVPDNIVAGVKLSAKASGTYIYTANNRPQLNACTLSDVTVSGTNQRPASIPVLDKIDATTAEANLLTLVQINNVYSVSKDGNDIVMNSASDKSGTSFNVNNLLNAVYNTLPDQELACNVIGIFFKKIKDNVEEYSLVPVLKSDFALAGATPVAVLPALSDTGSIDSENPKVVAKDKVITIYRPAVGFTGTYSFNGTETTMTAASYDVTITNETTADVLTLTSSRPYYKDTSITYYYKANPELNEYVITYPAVQSYLSISGPASAVPATNVVLTGQRKVKHYYPGEVTVWKTGEEQTTVTVTKTPVSDTVANYSFTMPAYPVTVKIDFIKDSTYAIDYQTGGKQTTGGTKPTEGNKYEGDSVTLATNTWTTNNFVFKEWRVVYVVDQDTTDVEVQNNKFTMPAHAVKIIAQWTPVYSVTYDKGSATSATGSVTENPQVAGAEITVKANGFTAPGYKFTGWKAGDQIYQPGDKFTMPAAAVTFTAQWDEPAYKKPGAWELVTDASKLAVGDYVIMAAKKDQTWYAGSSATKTANQNLKTETNISVTDGVLTYNVEEGKDINDHIFQIKTGNESNTFAFYNEKTNMYLYAPGTSGKNYLVMNASYESVNASWSISSITNDGEAVVNAKCELKNRLSINTTTFSCYDGKMTGLQFYKFYPTARKVYFNANAGEDVVTDMPEMQRADAKTNIVEIPDQTPQRTGYTFSIWNSAQQGTGTRSAKPGDNLELWQSECTLYAQWSKNTPLLTVATVDHGTISAKPYDMDVIAEGGSANVEYNKTVVISHTDDVEQYAFKSWKIFKTDDEKVTITPTVGQTSTTFDMPDYPVTVSAIYEDKSTIEYTLTYDANDGTGTMEGNPFTKNWNNYITVSDNKNGEEDIFTKTNCTFNGWNTKKDGTGTSYAAGSHFYIKSDVTLYAQWKGIGATYTIQSTTSVEVTVGAAPAGSTASFNNTYSTKTQLTSGNSMTLTLSGYAGKVITGVTLSAKSNSNAGAGTYEVKVGNKTLYTATGTYAEIFGAWATQFETQTLSINKAYVEAGDSIVIKISASANSLHCQSFTIQYATPDYTRTFTNHNVSTICVPGAVAPGDRMGASFYEIAYKEAEDDECRIFFDEVAEDETLEAGKPYVVIPEGGTLALLYTGSKVNAPVDGEKGLTGTFTDIAAASNNVLYGNYIFSQNKYWFVDSDCSLAKNRAYIQKSIINADFTPVDPAPGRRRIVMGANGTEEVTTPTIPTGVEMQNAECTMQGVQKLVIDNQLIIIRGGKMYNAAGQLVK